MLARPNPLEKLLSILRTLPSVGPKMSERIAFYLLKMSEPQINELVKAIQETCRQVHPCSVCGYLDDRSPCRICSDLSRDQSLLCVIENSQDLVAMSRIKNFNGVYHVLGGALSPLDGIGPQDLRIDALMQRLAQATVREVILALNPDMEGETTADYLIKQIQQCSEKLRQNEPNRKEFKIKVTRLAQGLPAGSELEYADELTLLRAFEGRKELSTSNSNSQER